MKSVRVILLVTVMGMAAVAEASVCATLLRAPSWPVVKALIWKGYEPSVAERIVKTRWELVPQILSRFSEGGPAYVTRGICASPKDFESKHPFKDRIYVSGKGMSEDHTMSAYSCPGGIIIEMQIPSFLFWGWSSVFARKTYRETEGRWGYMHPRFAGDLEAFITRVELIPLRPKDEVRRITYEEFRSLREQD